MQAFSLSWRCGAEPGQAYLLALLHAFPSVGAESLCDTLHELQRSHSWGKPAKALQTDAVHVTQIVCLVPDIKYQESLPSPSVYNNARPIKEAGAVLPLPTSCLQQELTVNVGVPRQKVLLTGMAQGVNAEATCH